MSPAEEFMLDQAHELKPILKKLHSLILSSSPKVADRLVYGIPFYYGNKRIFYINPQKKSVELGFCEGHLLSANRILKTKDRKQVKTIGFKSIDEIQEDILLPIIHEAILIDQLHKKR
jgi:hypothetical protein